MSEENKALVREGIRIWTTGDFDAANEIYSPDRNLPPSSARLFQIFTTL
jgi:hypothetical protein